MKALITALALLTLVAGPTFAQSVYSDEQGTAHNVSLVELRLRRQRLLIAEKLQSATRQRFLIGVRCEVIPGMRPALCRPHPVS
jgi:hypothetical protein